MLRGPAPVSIAGRRDTAGLQSTPAVRVLVVRGLKWDIPAELAAHGLELVIRAVLLLVVPVERLLVMQVVHRPVVPAEHLPRAMPLPLVDILAAEHRQRTAHRPAAVDMLRQAVDMLRQAVDMLRRAAVTLRPRPPMRLPRAAVTRSNL